MGLYALRLKALELSGDLEILLRGLTVQDGGHVGGRRGRRCGRGCRRVLCGARHVGGGGGGGSWAGCLLLAHGGGALEVREGVRAAGKEKMLSVAGGSKTSRQAARRQGNGG